MVYYVTLRLKMRGIDMPGQPERMIVDLSTIWRKLPETITETLFKNTVKSIVEEHYIAKGLVRPDNGEQQ